MPVIKEPNVLVTGTPGVGKSHLSAKLAEHFNFQILDVSKIATENGFVDEYDAEYDCPILNEDKVIDYLDPILAKGGHIVEYHGCDFFPERFFDAVFVVRCNNTILYDRLKERNYNEKKVKMNIECEIFLTILEEAQDSYSEDIIFEVKGETPKDTAEALKVAKEWYNLWKRK